MPEMHDAYKRAGCGSIALKLKWLIPHEKLQRRMDYLLNKEFKPFLESGDFHLTADLGFTLPRNSVRSKEELEMGYPMLNDRWLKQYLDFIDYMQPRLKIKEWSLGQETPSNARIAKYVGTWSEAMGNFVTLARMGSRRLKKLDPEIKIYAGTTSSVDIAKIEMGDIVKEFDHYYLNAYTGQWDLNVGGVVIPEISQMEIYREHSALSVSLGKGKYIANLESGYSIPYGAPFDTGLALDQARMTARTMIISKAAPVSFFQLYKPNSGWDRPKNDSERHMATLWKTIYLKDKYHWVPLPGCAMYSTLASELAFAKFEAEIIRGDIYCYVFSKPDGSTVVTIWNIEKKQPFAVHFPKVKKMLNMYGRDITGKPLVISPDPVYITPDIPADQAAALMKKAVLDNAPEAICAATPDKVYVRSLIKETRNAEIRMPGSSPVKVKILPAKVNTFKINVSAPGKLVIGIRQYDIPMEKVQVHRLRRVSGFSELRDGKPGILRVPDHVRPLEALQPERCYFKTEGFNPNGHNISAKYWTGYDDNNFYLAVEVDDPVHLQRHTLKDIWRDDCLQFVLSPVDYQPSSMRLSREKKPKSEYNFGLALTLQGVQLVKFLGNDAGVKDYPAKVTRKGNTTIYEVAIPWSAVGGKARRFGFLVFDNNNPAQESAPYRLELTPGIAGGADSSKLAQVVYE